MPTLRWERVDGGVRLRIDTEGQVVNAYEGEVTGIADGASVDDGGSVVGAWIARPIIHDGELRFAGITPGGFTGVGTILTVRAKEDAVGAPSFARARVLLADGQGSDAQLTVHTAITAATVPALPDTQPPIEFVPVLGSGLAGDDGAFVAFSTLDKESGVARYEVREGDGEFVVATSPFAVAAAPGTAITVRAVDAAGNAREASVVVPEVPRTLPSGAIVIAIIIVLLAAVWLVRSWQKRSRSSRSSR